MVLFYAFIDISVTGSTDNNRTINGDVQSVFFHRSSYDFPWVI